MTLLDSERHEQDRFPIMQRSLSARVFVYIQQLQCTFKILHLLE